MVELRVHGQSDDTVGIVLRGLLGSVIGWHDAADAKDNDGRWGQASEAENSWITIFPITKPTPIGSTAARRAKPPEPLRPDNVPTPNLDNT